MGAALVSYVIVSYKTREMTLKCLAGVVADADDDVDIVLVDNASGDGTVEAVAERFPQVRVVASQENLGFGRGNNAGMAVARGELLVLLNTDAFVSSGFTRAMRAYWESHPDVGLFGPRVLNADGTLQVSCYPFPTPGRAWLENLWLPHGSYRTWRHDRERDVDWVIGACMGVSARMFREVGGFDERFFMYSEEADWQWRIRQAGWRVTFTPSTVVTHLGGASGDVRETINPHFFRSLDQYVRKHFGVWGQVSFRMAMVVGCTLRMLGWLLVGPFTRRAGVAGRKVRFHARLAWRQLTAW